MLDQINAIVDGFFRAYFKSIDKMINLCFVIVTYGRSVETSATFLSFIENISLFNDYDVMLYIRNNGPSECDFTFTNNTNVEILYTSSIENVSLASIYNDAINYRDNDFIIIFDQDTIITHDFCVEILKSIDSKYTHAHIHMPSIISKNRKMYPRDRSGIVADGVYSKIDGRLSSISSGLMISKPLVEMFVDEFKSVFDSRFLLYGVDSSFFLRLRTIMKNKKLSIHCSGNLLHSLSSQEEESFPVKVFRCQERLYDLALQTRFYPRLTLALIIPRELFKSVIFLKKPFLVVEYFKVVISGVHPRRRSK